MSVLALFLQGLALGFSAAASPGPFQTYLVNQTLIGGWRRGVVISMAPLISDIPIVLTILFLLERLPASFLRVVSVLGGIFLLYVSFSLWRQWRSNQVDLSGADQDAGSALSSPSNLGYLLRGIAMNALSPGPYTFWALVNGPIVLAALQQSWLHALAFLLGFYGMIVGCYMGIAALFHQARRLGPRFVHSLLLVSIVILLVFALLLLFRGVAGW